MDRRTDGQAGGLREWVEREANWQTELGKKKKIMPSHGKIALPLICYTPGPSLLNDVLSSEFIGLLGIPL